jgi:Holliday junction resolvasome RuvABC endonuclease subunit
VTTLDPTAAGITVIGLDLSLTGAGLAVIDLHSGSLTAAVHRSPAPKQDVLGGHVARHRELIDGLVTQALACDPVPVVIEGLQFSVASKDGSLTRRGFLWWAVAEGLVAGGAPVLEVAPSQIKQLATGKGNAGKAEVVAAYATVWPDATRVSNVEDRADASFAAGFGTAGAPTLGTPPVPAAGAASGHRLRISMCGPLRECRFGNGCGVAASRSTVGR